MRCERNCSPRNYSTYVQEALPARRRRRRRRRQAHSRKLNAPTAVVVYHSYAARTPHFSRSRRPPPRKSMRYIHTVHNTLVRVHQRRRRRRCNRSGPVTGVAECLGVPEQFAHSDSGGDLFRTDEHQVNALANTTAGGVIYVGLASGCAV